MLAHQTKRVKNLSIDSNLFYGITSCESLNIRVFCSADRPSRSDRSIKRLRDENDDPFPAHGFSPPSKADCADSLGMLEN
jgi:hypothetical protein